MATIKVTARQKRTVYDDTVSITSFDGELRDVIDGDADPETLLIQKVEHLAALLGCTETEAERLILQRC